MNRPADIIAAVRDAVQPDATAYSYAVRRGAEPTMANMAADESEARRMLLALCERMGDAETRRRVVQAERAQAMAAAAKRAVK